MRIGFLYSNLVWNVAYRVEGPAQALIRRGHDVRVVTCDANTVDPRPLYACDVVHIYRLADDPVRQCVDRLRERGIAVVWDDDDDIRLMPPEFDRLAKTTPYMRGRQHKNKVQMMRRADLVTTTSDYLVAAFQEASAARAVRIENYLFPAQYRKPRPNRDGILLGWIAAREHEACDRALGISRILGDALERHPSLRLQTVGVRLALDTDRYEHGGPFPLRDLNDRVRAFDIAIAPLGDVPMSYSRSNVKVKEYSAAGVPWLASARGPYVGLGPKQGGMLVADDEWPQALDALIESRFKRYRLSRRASSWAKTQSIDRHVDEWLAAFEQAIQIAQERRLASGSPGRATASY